MCLTQPLHRAVQQMPDATYSVYRDRTLSNRQVCDRVARIAGGLHARGVARDARVGLLSPNTDTFFHVCLAIAWADAVVVPLNTRWTVKEIGAQAAGDHLQRGRARPGRAHGLADLLGAGPVEDAHRQGEALAGIFYTGGTTGSPKGVMLSHRGIFLSAIGSTAALSRVPHDGATLLVAPAFQLAGFAIWVRGMVLRMTAVPMPLSRL